MKRLTALAAIAALAACAEPATEEAPAPAETVAAETAPATTAADMAGTYEAKYPDGSVHVVVFDAAGNYTETDAKGAVTKGMFAVKDGKSCFDPEGDAAEVCWTDAAPDAIGAFSSTAPDGTVVKVTRRAEPATAATAAPAAE